MKRLLLAAIVTAIAAPSFAASLSISLGIRETGAAAANPSFPGVGANGGASGGIEWVNFDGQTLTLDGTWQQFTFDLNNDTLTAFAGGSANGILEGTYGTIEHIRIKSNGTAGPFQLFLDTITNDYTDDAGAPQSVVFGDFEDAGLLDLEAMFQEPEFSGSTAGNIVDGTSSALVSDLMANTGTQSNEINFTFEDAVATRWLRLTTFNASNLPNPTISFQDGVVSFYMKGTAIPEPSSVALAGLALVGLVGFARRK